MIKLKEPKYFRAAIKNVLENNSEFIEQYYSSDQNNFYCTFAIPKRNGGSRIIEAPVNHTLKAIQRLLNEIFRKHLTYPICATAFIKNRGILDNAKFHLESEVILNVDLENFFNSINRSQIVKTLKSYPYNIDRDDVELLSKVATKNDHLVQGSALSPTLSNIIADSLDKNLLDYCSRNNIRYSRYADDMSFSITHGRLENETQDIRSMIETSGFKINEDKVKIKRRSNCLMVTGLVVNGNSINVKRQYIKRVKSILHKCEYWNKKDVNKLLSSLRGRIEYIGMVRGKEDFIYERFLKKYNYLRDNLDRLPFKYYNTKASLTQKDGQQIKLDENELGF